MRIGLIGTGNLLEAILAGSLAADVPSDWFVCSTRRAERARELADRYDVACTPSNRWAAADANLVLVGVSPDALADVLVEIGPELRPGAVVAVGTVPTSLAELEAALPGVAVVRLMPSVAARVRVGICGVARGTHVSDDQLALVTTFLAATGEVHVLAEAGLDALGSLAGSGPAYLAAVAQAMADAGAGLGINPDEALRLAVRTMLGTAALLQAGESPQAVCDAVGHPGGSTMRSLTHLRDSGALDAVGAAVDHRFER